MAKKWPFQKKKKRSNKGIKWIIIAMVLIFISYNGYKCSLSIGVNIDKISVIKATAIVNQQMNDALSEAVEQGLCKNLFDIITNEQGETSLVQGDTEKINSLITFLVKNLQDGYEKKEASIVRVPVGSLLGNKILSECGPSIPLSYKLLSVASMNYITEFEEQGINQTKYKLFLQVRTRVSVMSPFYSKELEVSNNVYVAEAVIVGRVPENYVMVPENEILETI